MYCFPSFGTMHITLPSLRFYVFIHLLVFWNFKNNFVMFNFVVFHLIDLEHVSIYHEQMCDDVMVTCLAINCILRNHIVILEKPIKVYPYLYWLYEIFLVVKGLMKPLLPWMRPDLEGKTSVNIESWKKELAALNESWINSIMYRIQGNIYTVAIMRTANLWIN